VIRLSLQNTWAHKRRLIGTFFAILIGVGFLSGTLILGDTLRDNFNKLFDAGYAGVDVVVRPEKPKDSSNDDGSLQASRTLEASLAQKIEAVDGVRAAVPETQTLGFILGKDGKALGGQGPPTFAASWNPDEGINPYEIVKGRAPTGPDEVVIDDASAKKGKLKIGDTAGVILPTGKIDTKVVGIAQFGSEGGGAGVTWAFFSESGTAAHLTKVPGTANSISVAAVDGVSQEQLKQRIEPVIGSGNEAITGEAIAKETVDDLNKAFLGFLTGFLVAFAGIAVFVGTFSIYNTFSIIVAQRARESALLRAIGATRRQVMNATLVEALVLGVVASVIGFAAGLGFAAMLKGVFAGFGLNLPAGGLTVKPSSIIVGLVVGVVVTLAAAFVPARRGSRVAPVEALRASAIEQAVPRRTRAIAGLVVFLIGVALLGISAGIDPDQQITVAGIGAAVTLVGMLVLGPVVAKPVAGILGSPLAKLGLTGELARENATRNPRRTSSTAAALLVGVAVVVLFTVFIDSAKNLVTQSVDKGFGGDFVISSGQFGGLTLPPSVAADAAKLDGVDRTVGLGFQPLSLNGDPADWYANADAAKLAGIVDLGITEGSAESVDEGAIGISTGQAETDKVKLGDPIEVVWPDETKQKLKVGMIYDNVDIVGDYLLSRNDYAAHSSIVADRAVFVALKDGASASQVRHGLENLVKDIGKPDVQTREEYAKSVGDRLNLLLGIVIVMLALAIIVAIMGIANTLSLSVHERTRELGILRAVGTTRRQVRRLVRWESVIVSTFGTVGGVALGVGLGAVLVQAAFSDSTTNPFTVSPTTIVMILVLGILVGILASTLPGYRAAKMEVLSAVSEG
jgi:putative ABC transport system permease protein